MKEEEPFSQEKQLSEVKMATNEFEEVAAAGGGA